MTNSMSAINIRSLATILTTISSVALGSGMAHAETEAGMVLTTAEICAPGAGVSARNHGLCTPINYEHSMTLGKNNIIVFPDASYIRKEEGGRTARGPYFLKNEDSNETLKKAIDDGEAVLSGSLVRWGNWQLQEIPLFEEESVIDNPNEGYLFVVETFKQFTPEDELEDSPFKYWTLSDADVSLLPMKKTVETDEVPTESVDLDGDSQQTGDSEIESEEKPKVGGTGTSVLDGESTREWLARRKEDGRQTALRHVNEEFSFLFRAGGVSYLQAEEGRGETVVSGGSARTSLVLRDQDAKKDGGESGVHFYTTLYEDYDVNDPGVTPLDKNGRDMPRISHVEGRQIAKASYKQFVKYQEDGELPETAPAEATAIKEVGFKTIDENGATKQSKMYVYTGDARISGVAAGVTHNEAVNRGQLDDLKGEVQALEKASFGGLAALAAVNGVPGLMGDQHNTFGMGVGSYRGHVALALGTTVRLTESLSTKASLGHSFKTGETIFNGGLSYGW